MNWDRTDRHHYSVSYHSLLFARCKKASGSVSVTVIIKGLRKNQFLDHFQAFLAWARRHLAGILGVRTTPERFQRSFAGRVPARPGEDSLKLEPHVLCNTSISFKGITVRKTHTWSDNNATIAVEGLKSRISVLHVTDSHLGLIDDRDPEHLEKNTGTRDRFAERRQDADGNNVFADVSFDQAMAVAAEKQVDLVALTGDNIHFPSQANVEHIASSVEKSGRPMLYTAGNHDWHFPGLTGRDDLRQEWWPALGPLHRGNPSCDAMEIGGVCFLTVDDSTYQVNEEQLEFTREQLARGLPTVLLIHIPLSTATLRLAVIERWKTPIMIGDPDWGFESRDKWGTDFDEDTTLEFVRLVSRADNLAAVLCGHVHFPHADTVGTQAVQYVTQPSFEGGMRMVELVPLDEEG